jgi:hypothetical protein
MYDGERRSLKDVAVLDMNNDCGARVIVVDSVQATNGDEDERPFYKGKLALAPGRHTLEVYYLVTRYTTGSKDYDITLRTNRRQMPDRMTFYSTNYKRITFDAEAGHKYTLNAECRPLDWPPGAMTWTAWVSEGKNGTQVATATEY